MNREKLKELLVRHESLRLFPYKDSVGKTSIGIGRNLDDVGITQAEALFMLDNDIAKVVAHCRTVYPWFNELDDTRQNVICSLIFNLGPKGFSAFKKTIEFMERKEYALAANEILCSRWASQVGKRALELSEMLRDGDIRH